MAILEQLGIDQTIFIQFAIVIIAFLALSQIAFAPYAKALELREEKTKGGEDLAKELQKKATDLKKAYEAKAREVNGEIKKIFDTYISDASKEHNHIISSARNESEKLVEETRSRVEIELVNATKKAKEEVPQLSSLISQKMLAK